MDPTGGRFNVGRIDPLRFPTFGALYLAEDRLAACSEKYGRHDPATSGGLSALELALTDEPSVTYFNVRGQLENVIDLRSPASLDALVRVFGGFRISGHVMKLAKRAEMEPPRLSVTSRELVSDLLDPGWRATAALVDVPANSQIFGQLVLDAGIHGIVYPSVRDGRGAMCLAVFPQNFAGSGSFVELADDAPAAARLTRLDQTTVDQVLIDITGARQANPGTTKT